MTFLQLVACDAEEMEAMKRWSSERVLDVLAARDPHLVIDLDSPSALVDPAVRAAVDAGAARDGASQAVLYTTKVTCAGDAHALRLRLPALIASDVARLLRWRVPFGRGFRVISDGDVVVDVEVVDAGAAVAVDDGRVTLSLDQQAARALATLLRPRRGTIETFRVPGLVIEIEPTFIRDRDGNVVDVIG